MWSLTPSWEATRARAVKKRFDQELTDMLLALRWWDFSPEKPADFLPVLCNENLDEVRAAIKKLL